jgi:thymidylate kinase
MDSPSTLKIRDKAYRFISIEGVDGVGKSSAIKMAAQRRRGEFTVLKSPPEKMSHLRSFYDDCASPEARLFFYLSSVAEVSNDTRNCLLTSDVCCDRYLLSTIAYHNVLCNSWGLEGYFELAAALGLKLPDNSILLLADRKTRLKRLKKRFALSGCYVGTDLDFALTEKVQKEYLRIAESGVCKMTLLDTSRLSLAEVSERILMEFER